MPPTRQKAKRVLTFDTRASAVGDHTQVGRRWREARQNHLPPDHLVVFQEAGHMDNVERPEEFEK